MMSWQIMLQFRLDIKQRKGIFLHAKDRRRKKADKQAREPRRLQIDETRSEYGLSPGKLEEVRPKKLCNEQRLE